MKKLKLIILSTLSLIFLIDPIYSETNSERVRTNTTKKYRGTYRGIVTNNKDPEKRGRVKVKFPWLRRNSKPAWARQLKPNGNSQDGPFFMPEIGDEVIISFIHGDIRHPVILGGLYNGQDRPPAH